MSKKEVFWTFRDGVGVKMSKKEVLIDISGGGRMQNV
jgi:hypothetical protein